jgi:hypothetical protein
MRLFLDTNIFPEFINRRAQYESVCHLIDAIVEGKHSACISTGCIYTLSFLFERSLKAQGIHKPEQTARLRSYLTEVLHVAELVDLSHYAAEQAINDEHFSDIEMSAAVQEVLIYSGSKEISKNFRIFLHFVQNNHYLCTQVSANRRKRRKLRLLCANTAILGACRGD